jgi:hypothetical protein
MVVHFRSFQTKHALMCKVYEQDKVSVMKHILCSLMNMSFLYVKMFNILIIKKLGKSLLLIENVPQ